MLSQLKQLTERYYHFWLKITNLKEKTHILPINFKNKWTKIIWEQKRYLFICLISEAITQAFYTSAPIFLGMVIENKQFNYFIYLIIAWFIAIICEYITAYNATLLETQCINSVQYDAYEFFLTVDPVYHTTRSSGKLFAKIERCARSYEEFLDLILFDLAPTTIGITTVVISFTLVDIHFGALAFILLLLIGILNIGLNLFTGMAFEKKLINADDEVKAMSMEGLTQIQMIRSSFASNEVAHSTKVSNEQMMYKEGTAWIASSGINFVTRIAYLASFFILGTYLFSKIQAGIVSTTLAITLLITYIRGTYEIIKIGRKLRKIIKSVIRIKDLFSYINEFGKQTFVVLSSPNIKNLSHQINQIKGSSIISLEVNDLHFDYNPRAKIFEKHKLSVEVQKSDPNKLYGIIGPSGMGKTTLLSILGGQLKPTKGTVILNGLSIYDTDDRTRRELIAIQGQIASSLSGTLKSSLLIGLPEHLQIYTDAEIINVLKEVGIWSIFEEKERLATIIGEGGLTLSGGQRQRLNFASLYLRAQYYQPLLILIDEPTSSLDEVSERAITDMIKKLAEQSLTFVIAHRLKTLEDAKAIMDFSLIDIQKDIEFYSIAELEEKSIYYKKLLQGDINIEN